MHTDSKQDAKLEVHEIKKELDSLASECPEIPTRILNKYTS